MSDTGVATDGQTIDSGIADSISADDADVDAADVAQGDSAVDSTGPDDAGDSTVAPNDSAPPGDTGTNDGAIDPHPDTSAPLAACAATPVLDLDTTQMLPSSETPPKFAAHYVNELNQSGGPLLVRVSGLDSNPLVVSMSIGSQSGGTFDPTAQGPASGAATVLAGPGTIDASSENAFVIRFHTTAGVVDVPVVDVRVRGTISSDCTEIDDAKITIFIPDTAGSIQFDGQSLADQLADPDTTVNGVPTWTVVLQGTLLPVGG